MFLEFPKEHLPNTPYFCSSLEEAVGRPQRALCGLLKTLQAFKLEIGRAFGYLLHEKKGGGDDSTDLMS